MKFRTLYSITLGMLIAVLLSAPVTIGHAQAPETVAIKFKLALLPMNESAFYQIRNNSGDAGDTSAPISYYDAPSIGYRSGEQSVEFKIQHGDTEKEMSYNGPPTLSFYKPGESSRLVGKVSIDPSWKQVLILAVSDAEGRGDFKMQAMDASQLKLSPSDIYVYNLTKKPMYTAIGEIKHAIQPRQLQYFDCDLSSSPQQQLIIVSATDDSIRREYAANRSFARQCSHLMILHQAGDPGAPVLVAHLRDL
mgnify:CR=1 FL=1|tara:strand:+ start:687 stop:1436 length:750 start_codon:yes stop_codon:yes gene_type:complete